jgi:hypothetical protein
VYVAYHSQPTFVNRNPAGTSGQVFVLRSTNGGVSYPQKTIAYSAGNADITFNVQTVPAGRALNGNISWTQGSAQPWVLPDPSNPNNVYVVAADDPTNANQGNGFDDMNVYIVRSTDQGVTWGTSVQVDAGPVGTTQFFPTAAIDDKAQCLVVTWYDTRAGQTNAAGHFLLDVFARASRDGGLTFGPEVQLNDVPFDPDLGARCRFGPQPPCQDDSSPLQTLRIGEYIGVAVADGTAHAVWTGNTATAQQILFDSTTVCQVSNTCPRSQGFWKNHPEAWPVTSLTLGSQTYTQAELLALFDTPPRGDASLILAHQLIAAKLNIANGSDPTPVNDTIIDADHLLSGFTGKLPYGVRPSSSIGQAMVHDANVLDSYNNGELTPNCTP